MRNLLIEAQTSEPAPGQGASAQFFHQFALATNAVEVADHENAQQELGIDRRSSGLAVAAAWLFAYESKADVLFSMSRSR